MAGTPYGLDFGAVMAVGEAGGCDLAMLSELLPRVEEAVLSGCATQDEE